MAYYGKIYEGDILKIFHLEEYTEKTPLPRLLFPMSGTQDELLNAFYNLFILIF